jgi:hypothetical protein
MHELINRRSGRLTRRGLLALGGFAAGGAAWLSVSAGPTTAAAASKESQKLARYQPGPNGKLRCDNCLQWRPPSSCVLVEGDISPSGWCLLYAPKR